MKNILSIAALAAILSAGAVQAAPNLVNDGDFHLDANCCGPYGTSDAFWNNVGYDGGTLHGVYNSTNDLFGYPLSNLTNSPGGKFYYSDAQPNYNSTYIYQTISGLTAGQKYTLTFKDAFGNENGGPVGNTAGWEVNFGGANPAGGSFSFPSDGVTKTTALYTVDPHGSGWFDEVMTFTATGATDDLAFKPLGSGFPPFALLTDVSLSAVPEPAAWTMILLGVGGLGALARRRRIATLAA